MSASSGTSFSGEGTTPCTAAQNAKVSFGQGEKPKRNRRTALTGVRLTVRRPEASGRSGRLPSAHCSVRRSTLLTATTSPPFHSIIIASTWMPDRKLMIDGSGNTKFVNG